MKKLFLLVLLSIYVLGLFAEINIADSLKTNLTNKKGYELAKYLLIIANYYYTNNNDSALVYAERALTEYQKEGNEKGIASCYGLLGGIYRDYGLYDTAQALNYKVAIWGEQNHDIRAYIACLELANTYEDMGKYKQAKAFYQKAIAGDYLPAKRAAIANMGLLMMKENYPDSAGYYFNLGLKSYFKADTTLPINKYNIATIYQNLASVAYLKKQYVKGIELLDKSINILLPVNNKPSLAIAYTKMASGYGALNNPSKQLQYLLLAKDITDSLNIPSVKEDVYKQLFNYYASSGKFKKAYYYFNVYEQLHDSLLANKYNSSLARWEVKYKVQDKINKIKTLEYKQKFNFYKTWFLIIAIILISLIIILILNQRRAHHKNEKAISEMLIKESKQKLEEMISNLQEKSSLIEALQQEITLVSNKKEQHHIEDKIELLRKTKILTDSDWNEYNRIFSKIFSSFTQRIDKFPDLTEGDRRQLMFIKLNLSQKEIALLMGISIDGVKRARQRVAKKLGLKSTANLKEFINNLD